MSDRHPSSHDCYAVSDPDSPGAQRENLGVQSAQTAETRCARGHQAGSGHKGRRARGVCVEAELCSSPRFFAAPPGSATLASPTWCPFGLHPGQTLAGS